MLSGVIAGKCKSLIATDFSLPMLKRAEKKCESYSNVTFQQGNILQIDFAAERFDVVVAANVIHLLEKPYKALQELDRVCKKGGRIIIPTYMNENEKGMRSQRRSEKQELILKEHLRLLPIRNFFWTQGIRM